MKTLIFVCLLLGSPMSFSIAQNYESVETATFDTPQELPKVEGLVRRIDLPNSKIKIKHEEIPNLDMPPMTMMFSVADPHMLEELTNGDRVLFTADMLNNELTVLWIEKQL